MPAHRTVVGFFLRLFVIYGLLAVPWPWVTDAYTSLYHGVGNAWFGSFGSDGVVRFVEPADAEAPHDTKIVIRNRKSQVFGSTTHNARVMGWLPTIETVALILATPLPWARRRIALLWGLLLVHAFIWLRLEVVLLHWFTGDQPWCIYRPPPLIDALLEQAMVIGVISPTPSLVVPLLIWMAATFRRGDLKRLLGLGRSEES